MSRKRTDQAPRTWWRRGVTGRPGEDLGRPWLRVACGSLAVVAGAVMLVVSAGDWVSRGAYVRAEPCSESVTRGCYVETTGVVGGKEWTRGRGGTQWVEIAGETFSGRPALADPEEVWDGLRRGAAVRVRLWRGEIVRVTVDGMGASETEESPLVEAPLFTGGAFAAMGFGAFFAASGREMSRDSWTLAVVPHGRTRARRAFLGAGAAGTAVWIAVWTLDLFEPLPLLLVALLVAGLTAGLPRPHIRSVG